MFMVLIVIAVVVQTIVNLLKEGFPKLVEHKGLIFVICSALGILSCIAFSGDVFAAYGLESKVPFLGEILSGVCAGGGSSIIYDIVKGIKGTKEEISAEMFDEEQVDGYTDEEDG